MPESNRPQELVYGYVHEPPAPSYVHQHAVGRLFRVLSDHVEEKHLGEVCVSPLDVVLDDKEALVVQPDVIFISNERKSMVRDRIWGAPDLVVEVTSPDGEFRDRTLKLAWYRRYGVKECWLVHPKTAEIEIVDCKSGARETFSGTATIRSRVLPDLQLTAAECVS